MPNNNWGGANKKYKSKISFKESMDLTELPVIIFVNYSNILTLLYIIYDNFSKQWN